MGNRLTSLQAVQHWFAMECRSRRGRRRSEVADETLPGEGGENGGGTNWEDKRR